MSYLYYVLFSRTKNKESFEWCQEKSEKIRHRGSLNAECRMQNYKCRNKAAKAYTLKGVLKRVRFRV